MTAGVPLAIGGLAIIGQVSTTPDLTPLASNGILGVLLAFVLWLFIDERKQHRQLRDRVLSDFLPALLSNSDALKDMAGTMVMIHQIAARPNLDPAQFAQWAANQTRTVDLLDRVERRLDGR